MREKDEIEERDAVYQLRGDVLDVDSDVSWRTGLLMTSSAEASTRPDERVLLLFDVATGRGGVRVEARIALVGDDDYGLDLLDHVPGFGFTAAGQVICTAL